MKIIEQDIITSKEWDVLCHVANLYTTMAAGVAFYIKKEFPEMYQADLDTTKGDANKFGFYSKTKLKDGRVGYNLYAMIPNDYHILTDVTKSFSYDAFESSFMSMVEDITWVNDHPIRIGVPYGIGCGLAGGDWSITKKMLERFEDWAEGKIEIIIHKLPL